MEPQRTPNSQVVPGFGPLPRGPLRGSGGKSGYGFAASLSAGGLRFYRPNAQADPGRQKLGGQLILSTRFRRNQCQHRRQMEELPDGARDLVDRVPLPEGNGVGEVSSSNRR